MNKRNKLSHFSTGLLICQYVVLTILLVLLFLQIYNSLDWRMEHDTPNLHYVAYLMDTYDLVPYRDVFETSMPGTFAFHYLIGKLVGYGELAFRYVDLFILTVLLVATYGFMYRFGRLPAVWASVLFALVYLSKGQSISLQKDYVGVIPVAFALLTIPTKTGVNVKIWRFALVGLLFGLSVIIKPQLGIAFPVIFGILLFSRWQVQEKSMFDFIKCAATSGAALLMPVSIALVWLSVNSALLPFADIFFEYIPLYNQLTGGHLIIAESERINYLITRTIRFGGYHALLIGSLLAILWAARSANREKAAVFSLACLFLCTILYAIYPTLAGKFWPYHYMPLAYFSAISSAVWFYKWPKPNHENNAVRLQNLLPLVLLLFTITFQLKPVGYAKTVIDQLQSEPGIFAPKDGRVDEMAAWLSSRLQPGDTVQPLDWTGGTIQAMHMAKAKLATNFMYDFHFYHHISSPINHRLRESFIAQLSEASPKFIIAVQKNKPWVKGIDTTRSFPELESYLADYYEVVFEGSNYVIYERVAGT